MLFYLPSTALSDFACDSTIPHTYTLSSSSGLCCLPGKEDLTPWAVISLQKLVESRSSSSSSSGVGRDFTDDRFEVWAANSLLTCAVVVCVLARVWWTCGNLPPSDSQHEPALGRVVRPEMQQSLDESYPDDEEEEEAETVMCRCRKWSLRTLWSSATRLLSARRRETKQMRGETQRIARHRPAGPRSPCECAYLRAASAAPQSRTGGDTYALVSVGSMESTPLPHTSHGSHTNTDHPRQPSLFISTGLRWIAEHRHTLQQSLIALWAGCAVLWTFMGMPYSHMRTGFNLNSCGNSSLFSQASRKRYLHCGNSKGLRGGREGCCNDISNSNGVGGDDDEYTESEEREEVEEEELWSLLEGIERRRRALTGRNLFRQPLPPRGEHRRHARRHGVAAALRGSAAGSTTVLVRDEAAVEPPSLPCIAAGVSLRFSTNRKERPLLHDRHGQWVPVAVIDPDYEYYSYNLDQVLPLH